jgi:hypothetical protein
MDLKGEGISERNLPGYHSCDSGCEETGKINRRNGIPFE